MKQKDHMLEDVLAAYSSETTADPSSEWHNRIKGLEVLGHLTRKYQNLATLKVSFALTDEERVPTTFHLIGQHHQVSGGLELMGTETKMWYGGVGLSENRERNQVPPGLYLRSVIIKKLLMEQII